MRCTISYNLYNLKNVKNTHGGVLFLVKLQITRSPSKQNLTLIGSWNNLSGFYIFLLKKDSIKLSQELFYLFLIGRAVNCLLGLQYPKKQLLEFCNVTGKLSTTLLWKHGLPNFNETRCINDILRLRHYVKFGSKRRRNLTRVFFVWLKTRCDRLEDFNLASILGGQNFWSLFLFFLL